MFDDKFFNLVGTKIVPGAAPTIRPSITIAKLREHFKNTWERYIKPSFDESWPDYDMVVPFEFINVAARRRPLAEIPLITFHKYVLAVYVMNIQG